MSWWDLYIILSTCCSLDENQQIWEETCKHADQLHTQNPGSNQPAAQAIPYQDPDRGYDSQAVTWSREADTLPIGGNEELHQESCTV